MGTAGQKSSEGHFEAFNALVERGWLGILSATEVGVFLAYLKHADKQRIARPSPMTIARYLGHAKPQHVRAARARLVEHELLTPAGENTGSDGPGRFRVNTPPHPPLPGIRATPLARKRGGGVTRNPDATPTRNRDSTPTRNRDTEQINEQRREQHSAARAVDAGQVQEMTDGQKHQAAVRAWCTGWGAKYAPAKFSFDGGKHGKIIKWMLAECGGNVGELTPIFGRYLDDDREYVVAAAHSLELLRSQFNSYKIDRKPAGRNGDRYVKATPAQAYKNDF